MSRKMTLRALKSKAFHAVLPVENATVFEVGAARK